MSDRAYSANSRTTSSKCANTNKVDIPKALSIKQRSVGERDMGT